jgi:drug/metabolite transporter (DMT)-like permease
MFCIRAYQYLPAYQVVLFTAFTPLYVTLIHDLFTKSFRPFFLITAILSFGSVLVLHYQNLHLTSLTGFFLVQLADLCFAFGQVAYKKSKIQVPDQNIYGLLFLGGFIITAASTTLFQGWQSFHLLSLKQCGILLYLGAIASGLCFFWWNKAGKTTKAGTLAVFNNLKIPLGVFVSVVFFQEKADTPILALSLVLIIFAIVLSNRNPKKIAL